MSFEIPNFPYSKIVLPILSGVVGLAIIARGAYSFFVHTRFGRGITRRNLLAMFQKMPNPLPTTVAFSNRVQPHSKIEQIADGLWIVKGSMPGKQFPPEFLRVMVIYRAPNSDSLLLFSALCMDEAGMKELDGLGKVEYIYVPCSWHTIDASAYKERYPNAKVVGPRKCLTRVEGKTAIDEAAENLFAFAGDSKTPSSGNEMVKSVRLLEPEGVSDAFDEINLIVDLPGNKRAAIINDMLINVPKKNRKKNDIGFGFIVRVLMIESESVFRKWFKSVFFEKIVQKGIDVVTMSHGVPVIGRENVSKYANDCVKVI